MKNKKNLERLFQEQFKDFNENPPEIVWENIQEKLQEKEKKRRVIPIWWRLGGIAALFMLGILGIRSLYDSNTISVENPVVIEKNRSPKNPILTPQENPIKEGENVSQAENENASKTTTNSLIEAKSNSRFEKNIPDESSTQIVNVNTKTLNKKTSLKANNPNQNADKQESMAQSNLAKNINSTEAKNQKNKSELSSNSNTEKSEKPKNDKPFELIENLLVQQKNTVDSTQTSALAENQVEPNALEELLKEKEENQKPKVEPKLNRWQISTAVAPVYLGSSSNGSPIDADFANNPKDYKNTISYGLGVNYDVNQKFSLRTGVSNLSLSYATEDVYFYPNINARGITTLNYSSQGAPINVQDFSANNEIQVVQSGAITQQMNYIEVPFELTYKVLDKKFGIQLISGFSTLFLNNNDLMVVSEGFSAQLGEATNLNQIHFSTNVGLGFRYIFWKSFQANFEPTFKYQLNTFSSNDGGFQPYFIGLYSGISYRF
ncbi:hypothetical protein [Flavobacterium sp.]|uniref:hypothetical protein n=1 Tax=Flavobacterium sp. TaxID=239 RepID=UPI00260D1056|nr:hypothetical protein [Flavobacterium sp.]MDD2985730.1 hypothetical protein [Flavobacterium sp.]